jgi:hypothetical protein
MKLLASIGKAFVPQKIRPHLRSYLLKAGVCNAQSVITHCGAKEKLLSSLALKRAIKRVKVRVQKL